MSKYNFSAGGIDFGTYEGETVRDAMEAFAIDAGYKSWQAMVDQAVELAGANNVEVREIDEFGRVGGLVDED